jgi:hypothetical protein
MQPSEVRTRILQDHVVIRERSLELVSLIARLRGGDRKAAAPLLRRGKAFLDFFISHIELENRLLVPQLRDTDGWGAARADRVIQEHREQMAEARALIDSFKDPFGTEHELAEQLDDFIAALTVDMAAEESASLSPDLLRDDVVGVDVEAG